MVPDFTPGTPPRAADFAALVAAIRELQPVPPPVPPVYRSGRGMRPFAIGGTAIAVDNADSTEVTATVVESLYQVGDEVHRQDGGKIAGVLSAMDTAPDAIIGLHADYTGDDPEFSAVAWQAEEGALHGLWMGSGAWHGAVQCGAILPERGVRGQKQRSIVMWPMPQCPRFVERDYWWAEHQGCLSLLPGVEQNIALAPVFYACADGSTVRVAHRWRGRLDKYGQLHITFA